ncbi:MAG: ABC transporter permease [Deltaproteobacteria bacterium RBG_16_48_10]|nr:MAG: ABC transporter permease [Deltaproteobacteria bacterium RBG_16_48_10]
MLSFIEATINGILMGGLYGFIAVSLSLIFGVAKIVNFAHGAFLMVAMFLVYWILVLLKIDPYVSAVLAAVFLFFFGYFFQNVFIEPILRREKETAPLTVILLTSGLMLVLENVALLLFGADYRMVKTSYTGKVWDIGGLLIVQPRLIGFILSLFLIFLTEIYLRKTNLGRAIRATSQDREAARLMGIDDYKVYKVVFGIGSTMLGFAASFLVPFYFIHPAIGELFVLKSFVIVVLGGLGSISGAFLAGIIVGLIESLGAQFINSAMVESLIFIIFIACLVVRPTGLLGKQRE